MRRITIKTATAILLLTALLCSVFCSALNAAALEGADNSSTGIITLGGGYAASGQVDNTGYISELYDASNGLITSDANYVLCASNGYVWIGGYGGIIRYDGSVFTRMDTSNGLTSGRALFEDSRHRIWVGTNDNGVVVIDGNERKQLSYQDGIPSSSIRGFAEDANGNIYIGTTSGVCFVNPDMELNVINDDRVNEERILRLDSDTNGRVYGQTKDGSVFTIDDRRISAFYTSDELGIEKITTIMADRMQNGNVYLGTNSGVIYYGAFGSKADELKHISVAPLSDVHYISYDCGRVWVSSTTAAGYLDENELFHILDGLTVNSGIEMTTSDYQGNMWFASSRQGIMKITASSFTDVTGKAGADTGIVNSVCLHDGKLYIGTDSGLCIIDKDGKNVENNLTEYIGNTRIRCVKNDNDGNLWVGTFTNGLGLIRYSENGSITAFKKEDGMPSEEVRCIAVKEDGTILAGTNNGLAVINNDRVEKKIDSSDVKNAVFLDVEEGENGEILVGTDGDGIYVIDNEDIRRIGRDDGLTSDVINRIKRDEERGLYWLITSNSIEYIKNGVISCVTTFPYNNNQDLYFDRSNHIWVVSACGIYILDADEMIRNKISDFRLYTTANGLSSLPSSYAFCELGDEGTLYIPVKNGVCSVDIEHFSDGGAPINADLSSVFFGDTEIYPDANGKYIIPAEEGRIRITASVFDYTLMNPHVEVYFEGKESDGINTLASELKSIEYTGLKYGNHILHIKVSDNMGENELLDKIFVISKKPHLTNLPAFKVVSLIISVVLAGLIVWRVTRTAIMRRQNQELKKAKSDAEIANTARTRFLDNMSQEILAPINAIVGINEMTLREGTEGVPNGYSSTIRNNAIDIRNASESLMYLVHDLLNMTAVESKEVRLVLQEYDPGEMLREIISSIRLRSQEKGLQFDVVIDEIIPRRLYGDLGKIRQILMKLLINSVKYTDGGSIRLNVSLEERIDDDCEMRFSVLDSGLGISEEAMKNMFTIYETFGEGNDKEDLGTEIGLDLSRRFAELMGGSLVCESEYGKGTEFVLKIPQHIIDKKPIGAFSEIGEDITGRSYVPLFRAPDADVLVVSNDSMTIKVIKGLLKATEVFVTTAANAEECTDKMYGTHFHVVLIDMMTSGAENNYLEMLHKKDPTVPVYAITANTTADEELYKSEGFKGCLSKPIDGSVLEKTIMKHLPEEIMEKPEDFFSRR